MAYFIECVRTGRKPTRVTAEDAVTGLQIVEAEKRSIETGQPVAV
jgi:predicted dehydrogenase